MRGAVPDFRLMVDPAGLEPATRLHSDKAIEFYILAMPGKTISLK